MKNIQVPYIDQTGSGAFTGCESAAAVMLLNHLGCGITLDTFLDRYLEKEAFETRDGMLFGPDPRKVFAGDPRDPEAMGCYAPVIIRALKAALPEGWDVIDESGATLEQLAHKYLDRDIPVIVWATIDMKEMIPGPEWYLKDSGELFSWRSNEHCLLLTGYDEDNYIFTDSWQNNGVVRHSKALAQERYASQYSQAIAVVRKLPEYIPLKQIRIEDPFWDRYQKLVTEEILPYQYASLCDRIPDAPPSRCIRNLRIAAGLEQGEFEGFVFQDTDLAKWLEAAAYSLARKPDPELERTADEMIELVGRAQQEDGYLNSYFTIRYPGRRFGNLKDGHELYTAGHFMEAAAAYYQVTGKDALLKIMCRYADLILKIFHTEEYKDAVPGHEEIELALYRMADVTGNESYRAMAYEFINRRGATDYLKTERDRERYIRVWDDRSPYRGEYFQAHAPVRQQKTVEGHAVRAMYMLSAMADLAGFYRDEALLAACERLYDNLTRKRMFITGSAGSSGMLERFTADYDLPNDSNYSESCASIGMAMFGRRMARVTGDAKYMDMAELALYNTVLAGVALDGKSFFYVNPLEVVPDACVPGTDREHVQPVRQKWFGCACCPPNIARTLASIGEYAFFRDPDTLWVNLLISGSCEIRLGGVPVTVRLCSRMPECGEAEIKLTARSPMNGSLRIRIPEYAENPAFTHNGEPLSPKIEKGYAVIPVSGTEAAIGFRFDMPARLIFADPMVWADTGKCAVKKGPMVYCLEQEDNGPGLSTLMLDREKPLREIFDPELFGGTTRIEADGKRLTWSSGLYGTRPPEKEPAVLRFIPYAFWCNRTPGEMTVWVRTNI